MKNHQTEGVASLSSSNNNSTETNQTSAPSSPVVASKTTTHTSFLYPSVSYADVLKRGLDTDTPQYMPPRQSTPVREAVGSSFALGLKSSSDPFRGLSILPSETLTKRQQRIEPPKQKVPPLSERSRGPRQKNSKPTKKKYEDWENEDKTARRERDKERREDKRVKEELRQALQENSPPKQ
jgi:hypothetical protein